MVRTLLADESGFIISAELVLVATILVIGLVVGLSEVQHSIAGELNDVSEAIGSLNQSYCFSGFSVRKKSGCESFVSGSAFQDHIDECDRNECFIACEGPQPEKPKNY